MTLRRFLDCGYALLVEAHSRIPNVDLLTAIERVDEALSGEEKPENENVTARQNESSLAQLEALMQGTGGFR